MSKMPATHFRHLSSHLTMVYGLNANERTNHSKQAILCPPTSLIQARRLCKGQTEEDQTGSTGG